tara:strand:+ start:1321 stop:1593 length:273 start_codon:yes stop_codon:yes gene_type:complete
MKPKIFFKEGPFFEARERLEEFSNSLYASYTLSETMEEFAKLQAEYHVAVSSLMDEPLLKAKRIELEYYESMIDLTAHSLAVFQEEVPHD